MFQTIMIVHDNENVTLEIMSFLMLLKSDNVSLVEAKKVHDTRVKNMGVNFPNVNSVVKMFKRKFPVRKNQKVIQKFNKK